MHTHPGRGLNPAEAVDLLTEARARTLLLVAPIESGDLIRQHDPLMSPIVWDLGHIAHFEEVWLVESFERGPDGSEGLRGIYNPFENPRAVRDRLPLPDPPAALAYMAEVRARALVNVMRMDPGAPDPLSRDSFAVRLVLQHEYQHGETILQTLQLKQGTPYRAPRAFHHPDPVLDVDGEAMVRVPGGVYPIGTDDRSQAYDNERPAFEVELPPYRIDRAPVSNARFLRFVDEGGYEREEFWSAEGVAWLREAGARAPKHWERRGGEWWTRTFDRVAPLDPRHPVCHVCYWEAEAFARFEGKRLPTEFEWEVAAAWDPATGRTRRFPWGDESASIVLANVDQLAFGTAPIGAYPRNVSPLGCYGMIGDVWEWTSSPFEGYPGFTAFPYPEYSEVFFGNEYRVLRGGSWATRPGAVRNTFRNWDYPIRRQIFSGLRCAADD
ncbi:MAG: ergothioneine biosynthesis protein EgtB [Gemmatimonadetes bacterium]|nr:MAG: ergothioneine biosynthesis protein EgtB [Gemmatimonadota bacterium]